MEGRKEGRMEGRRKDYLLLLDKQFQKVTYTNTIQIVNKFCRRDNHSASDGIRTPVRPSRNLVPTVTELRGSACLDSDLRDTELPVGTAVTFRYFLSLLYVAAIADNLVSRCTVSCIAEFASRLS